MRRSTFCVVQQGIAGYQNFCNEIYDIRNILCAMYCSLCSLQKRGGIQAAYLGDETEAIEATLKVRDIPAAGGFNIRNWASNSPKV